MIISTEGTYGIGVRDGPHGICRPDSLGAWIMGLECQNALGKFFRRRERRCRRPRPDLFR